MRHLTEAFAIIDAVNAEDPRSLYGRPLALVQGERCWDWACDLDPNPSGPLLLAARAHHVRRWELPRASHPEGRAGYLAWRREQKGRHAVHLRAVLKNTSVAALMIERAVEIIEKQGLGTDPEVQSFEDAVCLTFLETDFPATTDRIADDSKMVAVVAKTLAKMSPQGRAQAATIPFRQHEASIVAAAVQLL
jgi:hypothetical protein